MKPDIPEEIQRPWRKRLQMTRENLGLHRMAVERKTGQIQSYELHDISRLKMRTVWHLANVYGMSIQEFVGELLGEDEPDYGSDTVAMARKEIMTEVAGLDLEKENLALPILRLLHTRARGHHLLGSKVNRANIDNDDLAYPRLWGYYRTMSTPDKELFIAVAHVLLHQDGVENIRKELPKRKGINGVRWDSEREKWRADFWYQDKHHFVGYFEDKETARKARHRARQKLYNDVFKDLTGMSRKTKKKLKFRQPARTTTGTPSIDNRIPVGLPYITRRKDLRISPYRVHIKNNTVGHYSNLDDAFTAARAWLGAHGFDPDKYYPDTLGPQNYKERHENRS